jgi:hypothetical protein
MKYNLQRLKKDIKPKGILNMIILFIVIILSYGWMKNKGLFVGFSLYHYLLWTTLVLGQLIYIIYVLITRTNNSNEMETEIYRLFTEGGFDPVKKIIIISDNDVFFESILILIALIIPFPFNLRMNNEHKLLIGMSKIGFYHILAAIVEHI